MCTGGNIFLKILSLLRNEHFNGHFVKKLKIFIINFLLKMLQSTVQIKRENMHLDSECDQDVKRPLRHRGRPRLHRAEGKEA